MTVSKPREDASTWMSGDYSNQNLRLKQAMVKEKLSTLTEITLEFLCESTALELDEFVGKVMTVHVQQDPEGTGSGGASSQVGGENGRMFTGTCISVESLGMTDTQDHFVAQIRPWFWLLTLTRTSRVFQNMTVIEIIEEVLSGHGIADYEVRTSDNYVAREYCVQYRETDFTFLSRLMEEEGLYYFFDHTDAFEKNEQLIICDSLSGHEDIAGENEVEFKPRDGSDAKTGGTIGEWADAESITRGKVSLADYDFTNPSVRQLQATEMKRGEHSHKDHEYYDLPGHYRGETGLGDTRTRIRMEADAIRFKTYRGAGDVKHFGTGFLFELKDHPEDRNNGEYLITEAVHYIRDSEEMADNSETFLSIKPQNIEIPEEITNDYSFSFGAVPSADPFRAPFVTPWPEIPGIVIGEVVGPDGEEIHTDEYGRVRVWFRWDRREDNPHETASCWIRVVTQWSGNNYGLLSIPRIGQEVVVQFEDGDPDRPIVTGMMYNADTMPPYVDERQPTRTGIMTRSSPDGGETDYNALVMEDETGGEYVHFQSQKDYQMVVKDSAQITIGDSNVNVDPEGQDAEEGSLLQTVKQNVTEIVEQGDKTETVQTGNMTVDVQSGSIDISAATTITMEAGQSITLTVGQSSIEITQSGVTITGSATVNVDALNTTVQGSAALTLRGGLVKIN